MTARVLQHQDVIGSYVVFDPTGRDLKDCYEVGRVEAITWDDADDGNSDGTPRPILTVRVNTPEWDGEHISVTTVAVVLPR